MASVTLGSGCGRVLDHYCDLRLSETPSRVTVAPLTYRLLQRYDETQLTALAEHSPQETTEGLTTAKSNARVELTVHAMRLPGGVCVRPEFAVALSYAPVTVDLVREIPPGSCKYREILAHELRHVGALRAHLLVAQHAMDAILMQRFRGGVFRFESIERATSSLEEIQNELLRQSQTALDAVAADQNAIDTPEEYTRLSHVCQSPDGA